MGLLNVLVVVVAAAVAAAAAAASMISMKRCSTIPYHNHKQPFLSCRELHGAAEVVSFG